MMSKLFSFGESLFPLQQTDLQKKHRSRRGINLVCKCLGLISLISIGFFLLNFEIDYGNGMIPRRLSSLCDEKSAEEIKDDCPNAPDAYMVIFYFIGTMYIFWAIAIICDDFFVPALEVIGEQLEISDDIAGATLMAAGGSAPELATSLIGTFTGSDVGFGTIVGSAVFNVLFVIACCVAFTPEQYAPLRLTWWPLARDCIYYIISLITLSIFFGWVSPREINIWEACVLFALYLGYCVVMYFNEYLHLRLTGTKISPDGGDIFDVVEDDEKNAEGGGTDSNKADILYVRRNSLYQPSKYRAGFFSLATNNGLSLFENAGVGVVYKLKGTVKEMFEKIDIDNSGSLDKSEIKTLLKTLFDGTSTKISESQVDEIMEELDLDKNGLIDLNEFSQWYLKSEKRLQFEERKVFDDLDPSNTGSISVDNFEHLLARLEVNMDPDELNEAIKEITVGSVESADGGLRITFDQFARWFEESPHWRKQKQMAEVVAEDVLGIWGEIKDFPKDNWLDNLMYIIVAPIIWPLACTAGFRDSRVAGNEKWCYFQFLASICWIGVYSYFMVDWITKIGLICGIPAVVMGLTLLAAGTSVPDLLSSVVVAKAGRGDMAVSSSIGSNIFDVTVGLPLPWILFNLSMSCPVQVGADNLVISVLILTGMVAAVVVTIMCCGWKMSKNLGITMMVFYLLFLGQDILRVVLVSSLKC